VLVAGCQPEHVEQLGFAQVLEADVVIDRHGADPRTLLRFARDRVSFAASPQTLSSGVRLAT